MMGLAELLAALEEDAQDEIVRLERDADAEAGRIVGRAEQQARDLRAELVAAAEVDAAVETTVVLSEARLEAACALRAAREAAVRAVLDDVRQRAAALRGQRVYPGVMAALVREAMAALPAARVLRIDPRDAELAAHVVREIGRDDVTVDPCLRTAGGVELASADQRLVRNTIEERLANAETDLRLRLARVLSAAPEAG